MSTSARNRIKAIVKNINKSDIIAEVTFSVIEDQEIEIVVPNEIADEIVKKNLKEITIEIDSRAIVVSKE
ncbi:MAG: hypothetical protein ACP6IS_06795 [Candidatus Asgardarchaeia archaeon]